MGSFLFLIPLSIVLGLIWLVVFLWSLESDQYSDLEGASQRILFDDDDPIKKK